MCNPIVKPQALIAKPASRRHDLEAECRILLLHGLLHLLGWDHELGLADADRMAAAERRLIAELGWQGDGLIGSVGVAVEEGESATGSLPDGEVSPCATPLSA